MSQTPSSLAQSAADEGARVDHLRFACARCRLRKIKCDRQMPCSTCRAAQTDCRPLEPRQRKSRAKSRVTPVVDASRLQRLEGLVQRLMDSKDPSRESAELQSPSSSHGDAVKDEFDGTGRLVIENSQRRYITSELWLELIDLLGEEEDNEPDEQDHEAVSSDWNHPYAVHAGGSTASQIFYPPPGLLPLIWQQFMVFVDPALKVVHCPTLRPKFLSFGMAQLTRADEALCYVVCFSSFMSCDDVECRANFAEPREELLHKYRIAIEEALKRAKLVDRPDFVTLQAFIMYLVRSRSLAGRSPEHACLLFAQRLMLTPHLSPVSPA